MKLARIENMRGVVQKGSHRWFFLALFLIAWSLPSSAQQAAAVPANQVWYVEDFELDSQDFSADRSGPPSLPGPEIMPPPKIFRKKDPQSRAYELVELMSKSLVADLRKSGINAQRLPAERPSSGFVVRGVFAELDEGNRLHRALIGFGTGASKMQVYVTLSDLASPGKPLYQAGEDGSSGKRPGAAITMNPYVAAAKFVMTKDATDKLVRSTAAQIANDLAAGTNSAKPVDR